MGVILPAVTSTSLGMSQSASLLQPAGWSVIVPIAIGAAIVVPGIASQYSRLADIVAAVIKVAVVAYAGYAVFDAWNQLSQITGATTGMMRGMAGNAPYSQTLANSFSQKFGIGVMPGIGLAVMAGAAALMILQTVRTPK